MNSIPRAAGCVASRPAPLHEHRDSSKKISINLLFSVDFNHRGIPVRLLSIKHIVALSILLTASGISVSGQATNTTGAVTDSQQNSSTTNQNYVFPTPRERFRRYVKSVVGPTSLLQTSVGAGINQWRDHPDEWEQGASGYGKRFASSLGKTAIRQTVVYGLDSAMGLDTGFKKSTRKGFGPRFEDALLENITSRNRSGERVPAVPRFVGIYTSQIIAKETWYPERYNYKDGLRSGTRSLLTGFGINLIREFVFNF